jgi:DNA-binding TFAR19-related protein (PDSD5 family)
MDPSQLAAIQAQTQDGPAPKDSEKEKAEAEARETMKRDLLATVLSSEARERRMYSFLSNSEWAFECLIVSRISLVAPDRAAQIEAILLRMAQSGQLKGRVTEQQLIDLLEQVRFRAPTVFLYLRHKQADDSHKKTVGKKGGIVVSANSPICHVLDRWFHPIVSAAEGFGR